MALKLDQHFMIDKELIKRLASYANLKKKEKVLEIGAGKGALTKELNKKCDLTANEIDKELIKDLKKFKVIEANALDLDFNNYDKIVSNLPYTLCEPILNKLVRSKIKLAVLTVPKTFVEKGLTKLILEEFYKVEVLEEVPASAFQPEPKTKSVVIRLTPKKYKLFGEVYLQQDKVIKNAVREAICRVKKLTKKEAKEKMPNLEFSEKKGFELNLKEWEHLQKVLKTIK